MTTHDMSAWGTNPLPKACPYCWPRGRCLDEAGPLRVEYFLHRLVIGENGLVVENTGVIRFPKWMHGMRVTCSQLALLYERQGRLRAKRVAS